MKRIALVLAALVLLLSVPVMVAHADDGTGYAVNWWTIDGGGVASSGGNFALNNTTGQPDAGVLSGGDYTLQGGYLFAPVGLPLYLPLVVRN